MTLEVANPMTFVRAKEAAARFGVATRTWLRWVAAGTAPAPAYRTGRITAWSSDDLDELAAQMTEKTSKTGRAF